MSLEHLFAGWRMAYVTAASEGVSAAEDECVFCRLLASDVDDAERLVVWRGEGIVAMLNAFPYASGHVMVMPVRHVRALNELEGAESARLWAGVCRATEAVEAAYEPDGCNLGLNLGRAAGAGIPGHLHVHVVPRWIGDTNFMTVAAGVRVLPEDLSESYSRLKKAFVS